MSGLPYSLFHVQWNQLCVVCRMLALDFNTRRLSVVLVALPTLSRASAKRALLGSYCCEHFRTHSFLQQIFWQRQC